MRVNVCYSVPVVCVVDTTTGAIERVIVDDEGIRGIEYCETADACTPLAPESKPAKRAREIAESGFWPCWEFGF